MTCENLQNNISVKYRTPIKSSFRRMKFKMVQRSVPLPSEKALLPSECAHFPQIAPSESAQLPLESSQTLRQCPFMIHPFYRAPSEKALTKNPQRKDSTPSYEQRRTNFASWKVHFDNIPKRIVLKKTFEGQVQIKVKDSQCPLFFQQNFSNKKQSLLKGKKATFFQCLIFNSIDHCTATCAVFSSYQIQYQFFAQSILNMMD